jgi:hypothetical protein
MDDEAVEAERLISETSANEKLEATLWERVGPPMKTRPINYLKWIWECMSDAQRWCLIGVILAGEAALIWWGFGK